MPAEFFLEFSLGHLVSVSKNGQQRQDP